MIRISSLAYDVVCFYTTLFAVLHCGEVFYFLQRKKKILRSSKDIINKKGAGTRLWDTNRTWPAREEELWDRVEVHPEFCIRIAFIISQSRDFDFEILFMFLLSLEGLCLQERQ